MILSRIGRALSRPVRSTLQRNVITSSNYHYNARTVLVDELTSQFAALESNGLRGLGIVRGYLSFSGAGKQIVSSKQLSNLNSILANPRVRRFFSSEAPKKRKYENYYPKDKKKIPKENESKSESKEDSGGAGGGDSQNSVKQFQNIITPLIFLAFVYSSMFFNTQEQKQISFQEFKNKLLKPGLVDHIVVSNKSVAKVHVRNSPQNANNSSDNVIGTPSRRNVGQYKFYFNIVSVESFEDKLEEAQEALGIDPHDYVPVTYVNEVNWFQELMRFAPTAMLLGVLWFMGRRMQSGLGVGGPSGRGGRGIFNMGKAHITKLDKNAKDKNRIHSAQGTIVTVTELVTILAHLDCYNFMEMFVGVGPSRVRSLFQEARQCAPSIIFIDEIDAIGRARGRGGFSGGNDERESTLNQLLVEMDGFGTTSGVVVLAGTNRPDILDKALLRPGRFDRQITIDKPDINGRNQIFKIYLKKLKLDNEPSHYSQRLAALTPGFAGADIANVCNEAALIAARNESAQVTMNHFEAAIDRVIGGLEKKNKVISRLERQTVAYHESGHAVAGWFLEHAEPLLKVTIVPRGTAALGFAQYVPNENLLMTKEQLFDMTCMTLGGRAAEQ
ncbi:ATP-DEPENDENT ZINC METALLOPROTEASE FTSH 10 MITOCHONDRIAL-LIKE, partial [Salix koriyanagi]